jgi:hypothetical protein
MVMCKEKQAAYIHQLSYAYFKATFGAEPDKIIPMAEAKKLTYEQALDMIESLKQKIVEANIYHYKKLLPDNTALKEFPRIRVIENYKNIIFIKADNRKKKYWLKTDTGEEIYLEGHIQHEASGYPGDFDFFDFVKSSINCGNRVNIFKCNGVVKAYWEKPDPVKKIRSETVECLNKILDTTGGMLPVHNPRQKRGHTLITTTKGETVSGLPNYQTIKHVLQFIRFKDIRLYEKLQKVFADTYYIETALELLKSGVKCTGGLVKETDSVVLI